VARLEAAHERSDRFVLRGPRDANLVVDPVADAQNARFARAHEALRHAEEDARLRPRDLHEDCPLDLIRGDRGLVLVYLRPREARHDESATVIGCPREEAPEAGHHVADGLALEAAFVEPEAPLLQRDSVNLVEAAAVPEGEVR